MISNFICVIGQPGCGKDTFAHKISHITGLKFGACSDYIYESMAFEMSNVARGSNPDQLQAVILQALHNANKEKLRPYLVEHGNWWCDINPLHWVQAAEEDGVKILTGIRRHSELKFARMYLGAKYRLLVVWVKRNGAPAITDNTTVTEKDADLVIDLEDNWQDTIPLFL